MGRRDETVRDLLRGIAVLVVDDDGDARDIHRNVLMYAGALVVDVRTADAALKIFARVIPDVLISDLRMPHHDGYWLMRHVRALPPDQGGLVGAIAVTGYHPYIHDVMRAADAGFNAHLTKPVDPHVLWHAILRVIGRQGRGLAPAHR